MEYAECGPAAAMAEARKNLGDGAPPGVLFRVTPAGRSVSGNPFLTPAPGPVWTVVDGPVSRPEDNDDSSEPAWADERGL